MSADTAVSAESARIAYPGDVSSSNAAGLRGAASGQSQLRLNLKRFLIGNKLNLAGLIIVVVFVILAIFGQALAPYDPYAQDITGSKLLVKRPPPACHVGCHVEPCRVNEIFCLTQAYIEHEQPLTYSFFGGERV